jgi:hypothetical protein
MQKATGLYAVMDLPAEALTTGSGVGVLQCDEYSKAYLGKMHGMQVHPEAEIFLKIAVQPALNDGYKQYSVQHGNVDALCIPCIVVNGRMSKH